MESIYLLCGLLGIGWRGPSTNTEVMARIADPGDGQRHLQALNTGKSEYTERPIKFNTIEINGVFLATADAALIS